MSSAAPLIPFTQKASNVCAYCRIRKQRCDRTLPSCSRCAAKFRHCDYTPFKEVAQNIEQDPVLIAPLVLQNEECGPDLSSRGSNEILRVAVDCVNHQPGSMNKLSEVVWDALDLADVDLPTRMEEYGPCIQQWCPIIDEDNLRGKANDLSQVAPRDRLRSPVLLLSIFLVTKRACRHTEHMTKSVLYSTMKQLMTIVHSGSEVHVEHLQLQMLLAVYEVGHGMGRQAYQRLNLCVGLLNLIELNTRKEKNAGEALSQIAWLKASITMLDRMIPLSTISDSLPLTCATDHPICKATAASLGPAIPPPSPTPFASSPRKVHIRATVALASGRVLEYIHARHHVFAPAETYDEVDDAIAKCIKMLVDKPQPHTWLHCDAIAMAFCSHLLLQQAEVKYLRASGVSPAQPQYTKAEMALHYSRRMAWDMVRVAINKIQGDPEVPQLPFAGLCCVLRAALAVIETREYIDDEVTTLAEIEGYRWISRWFASRWAIGVEYLQRVEELLSALSQRA